jgi:hypothetical protein
MATPFNSSYGAEISIPGLPKLPRVQDGGPYYNAVDEHYLTTMGTRLISGRGITAEDRDGKAVVRPARFSLVYRNRGGRWLIMDHHSSVVPAPAQ